MTTKRTGPTTQPETNDASPSGALSARQRHRPLPEPDFFTVEIVAAKLSCHPKTIRRRIEAGLLKATRDGGRYLIKPADYYVYLHQRGLV